MNDGVNDAASEAVKDALNDAVKDAVNDGADDAVNDAFDDAPDDALNDGVKEAACVGGGAEDGTEIVLVVDTSSYSATRELLKFAERPEVEELHTVAGDGCVLVKVRAIDTEALESFLMEIQSLEGVRAVRSYITLSTFIERGPAPIPAA